MEIRSPTAAKAKAVHLEEERKRGREMRSLEMRAIEDDIDSLSSLEPLQESVLGVVVVVATSWCCIALSGISSDLSESETKGNSQLKRKGRKMGETRSEDRFGDLERWRV